MNTINSMSKSLPLLFKWNSVFGVSLVQQECGQIDTNSSTDLNLIDSHFPIWLIKTVP